jgi:hypothetical protein
LVFAVLANNSGNEVMMTLMRSSQMSAEQTYPQAHSAQDIDQSRERLSPPSDLVKYLRQYASERPEVVAVLGLGIGLVLGWKLKSW